MSAHARLLRETPIFGAIREDIIDHLLEHGRAIALARGEWLLREGDPCGAMYVIEEGELAILKLHQGRQYLISTLGRGDCIGEMALFDLMPRSASALAVAPSRLLEIDARALFDLYRHDLEQFALIQMNMGREVTRRLRRSEELVFHHHRYPEFDVAACAPRRDTDPLPSPFPDATPARGL